MAINDTSRELILFHQLAEAIGESLEAVYNMQEKERSELITVLGLGKEELKEEEREKLEGRAYESSPVENERYQHEHAKVGNSKIDDSFEILASKLYEDDFYSNLDEDSQKTIVSEEATRESDSIEDLNNNALKEDVPVLESSSPVVGPLNEEDNSSRMDVVHPMLVLLQRDADLVMRLLGPDRGPLINAELVLAYLEAHRHKVDRVQVVVEELAGVDNNDSQTPERQHSMEMVKSKKGKGKSSKFAFFSDLDHRLSDVLKRQLSSTPTVNPHSPKKPKLEVEAEKSMSEPAVVKELLVKPRPPVKISDCNGAGLGEAKPGLSQVTRFLPIEVTEDPVEAAAVLSLVDSVSDMFPHTPLDYLRARCKDLVGKEAAFLRFTEELLVSQTPPPDWRQMYAFLLKPSAATPGPSGILASSSPLIDESPILEWENEKHGELLSMFPKLSPQFLKEEVESVSRSDGYLLSMEITKDFAIAFQLRVEKLWGMSDHERSQLATRSQWELKMKEDAELQKWSGKMTPLDFLDTYEDPVKYFKTKREVSEEYKAHALVDLKGRFRFQSIINITRVFSSCGYLLLPTVIQLGQEENTRQTKRTDAEFRSPGGPACISFLKEKKFIELENQIAIAKKIRETDKELKVAAARLAGALVDCECCYSSDCLEDDLVKCGGGHLYCRDCVETCIKVAMGEGKIVIECLGQCDEEISWQELSKALQPNILSKLIQKRQAVEVEKAGMEDVVACPYCPYVTIMDNEADKVLVCRNPDCGRESCRLCREPNHVPLRCEEVEKGEKTRKMIEEKLTEAMLRECVKCSNKFYKEEGCNKMTCRCGAKMCYLCKKEVTDYSHFYGQGGTPTAVKTCPLWSDNKLLHQMELAKAAELAREGLAKENVVLSNDPTKDIVEVINLPESEDQVRDKLFTRWMEVSVKVGKVMDAVQKERLVKLLENIRLLIGGNEVLRLKNPIQTEMESIWNRA